MLGVPDPRVSVEEQIAADAPRLESLRQHGWTVAFKNYAPVSGANYELPRRIEATRESLRVRLIIEGWTGGVR
jgi:outer membrane biogenesis lipoprotein LolB